MTHHPPLPPRDPFFFVDVDSSPNNTKFQVDGKPDRPRGTQPNQGSFPRAYIQIHATPTALATLLPVPHLQGHLLTAALEFVFFSLKKKHDHQLSRSISGSAAAAVRCCHMPQTQSPAGVEKNTTTTHPPPPLVCHVASMRSHPFGLYRIDQFTGRRCRTTARRVAVSGRRHGPTRTRPPPMPPRRESSIPSRWRSTSRRPATAA